ncbi:MAG: hypothetical protein CFE29_03455 [Bradyrhizobiaceae bacterium PARB1]|nr:MAG: hypothetical protein CFE29_03455 [Bradyrhizobiaceae bacterium PARB1]
MTTKTLRSNRKWTEADLERMVAMLTGGDSVEKVARQLRRTEAAIRVRATKLRVSASSDLAQRAKRNEELGR